MEKGKKMGRKRKRQKETTEKREERRGARVGRGCVVYARVLVCNS
jgi:hypothetical protein